MGFAAIFTLSFGLGLSGAMVPGPMLAATISRSARGGFWAGPLIVLGHGILEMAVVIGIAFGLAGFLERNSVSAGISLLGGVILLYMGGSLLLKARTLSLRGESGDIGASKAGSIGAGVLTSLSNPYWSIWWATAGLAAYQSFVGGRQLAGAVAFFSGHIASDLAWFSFVALLVSVGRRFGGELIRDKVYRVLMVLCGLALLGYGGLFLWKGYVGLTGAAI